MIRSKSLAVTAVLGLVVVATASGCSSNSSGSGSSASPSANAVALTPDVQAKLQKVIDDVRDFVGFQSTWNGMRPLRS